MDEPRECKKVLIVGPRTYFCNAEYPVPHTTHRFPVTDEDLATLNHALPAESVREVLEAAHKTLLDANRVSWMQHYCWWCGADGELTGEKHNSWCKMQSTLRRIEAALKDRET